MSHAHGVEVLGAETTDEHEADASSTTSSAPPPQGASRLSPGKRLFENIKNKVTAYELPDQTVQMGKYAIKGRFTASLVCGAAGAFLWKGHPVLGYLTGASLASGWTRVYHGDYSAFGDMAASASGVYGSLHFPKHPILGYIGGHLLGDMAVSSVETAVGMAKSK